MQILTSSRIIEQSRLGDDWLTVYRWTDVDILGQTWRVTVSEVDGRREVHSWEHVG